MTEPRPPDQALDEQEREIARILRALPGGEPPPALDASILRAAANAAAGTRRPRARWLAPLGSFWGVGGAAAAVLALGISWQMLDPSHRQAGEATAPASVSEDAAADSAVVVEFGKQSRELPSSAAAPPPPARMSDAPVTAPATPRRQRLPGAPTERSAPAIAAAPPPEAFPAAPTAERAEAPPAPAAVPEPAPGMASADAVAGQEFAESRESAADAVAEGDLAAATGAVADAAQANQSQKSAALAREAQPQTPGAWLARVRRLHAADRIEEARASLREFRRQYPDHAIPSDLAPLLRE